jgi:hypothetical protein
VFLIEFDTTPRLPLTNCKDQQLMQHIKQVLGQIKNT